MLSKIEYRAKPTGFSESVEVDDISKAEFIRLVYPEKLGHIDISESVFRKDGSELLPSGINLKGSKMFQLGELTLNLCKLGFKK